MEMTKEEYIEKLIDLRKQGHEQPRNAICNEVACSDCYFVCDPCNGHAVINILLDHIIGLEESTVDIVDVLQDNQKETNLEHYFNVGDVTVYLGQQIIHLNDNCWDAYKNSNSSHIIEWLLLPYEEPPKPKYKLSKFEYDLLKCYCEPLLKINDIWILAKMKSTGYFKDIPHNVSIEAILDNCEVIDE